MGPSACGRKRRRNEDGDGVCVVFDGGKEVPLEFCSEILDSLMKLRHPSVFEEPVDRVENPDYFKTIWRPMDFRTVKSKLNSGRYSNSRDFVCDLTLIFSNASRYFALGSYEFAAAKHLRPVFETKWQEAPKLSKPIKPKQRQQLGSKNPLPTCGQNRLGKPRLSAPCPNLKVKKSVLFDDPSQDLKELEKLCGYRKGNGSEDPYLKIWLGIPLKSIGLYFKQDELQGVDGYAFFNADLEEGEIMSWEEEVGDWEDGEIRSCRDAYLRF